MKRIAAALIGCTVSVLACSLWPACSPSCDNQPQVVQVQAGSYVLDSRDPGGSRLDAYSLVIGASSSGAPSTVQESFVKDGVQHLYRYEVRHLGHVSLP